MASNRLQAEYPASACGHFPNYVEQSGISLDDVQQCRPDSIGVQVRYWTQSKQEEEGGGRPQSPKQAENHWGRSG